MSIFLQTLCFPAFSILLLIIGFPCTVTAILPLPCYRIFIFAQEQRLTVEQIHFQVKLKKLTLFGHEHMNLCFRMDKDEYWKNYKIHSLERKSLLNQLNCCSSCFSYELVKDAKKGKAR